MKKYKQFCVGVGSMIESDDGTWVPLDEYNTVKDTWSKQDLKIYELESEQIYLQSDLVHNTVMLEKELRTNIILTRSLLGSIILNGITVTAILSIFWNIL